MTQRAPTLTRQEIIDTLHQTLHALPTVRAAWLGGSEASGRTDRYDFGMRYLQRDLPPDVYQQVEPLFLCSDLADLERKQATALTLFRATLSELRDIAVAD